MIENELLQYGIAGIFIIYLMWDKQTIMKLFRKLEETINKNSQVISELCYQLKGGK